MLEFKFTITGSNDALRSSWLRSVIWSTIDLILISGEKAAEKLSIFDTKSCH